MQRFALQALEKWKDSAVRKPLVLHGARQVGKTWLMKEFGRLYFKNVLYVNFETNRGAHRFFDLDVSPSALIPALSAEFRVPAEPGGTLIIFDEIQECQRAKDSLKYFNESAPEYHVIAAGSLLGVASGSFPVGQVDLMTLRPLNFVEFLLAAGEDIPANAILGKQWDLVRALHRRYIDFLKCYFYVGGMPEAVLRFAGGGGRDFEAAREAQNGILFSYYADFAKHISVSDVPKVRDIWDSIPGQFAKDNHKFAYNAVKPSARGREYENAVRWLADSGLVYRINRVSLPNPAQLPLSAYAESNHFKMYILDIGLLSCKSGVPLGMALDPSPDALFAHFKGALTEQFVLQELIVTPELGAPAGSCRIFYWGEWNKAEVDFLIQYKNEIIPIEVKSARNTRSRSLQAYMAKYAPGTAIRASQKEYGREKGLYSVPLYEIGYLGEIIGI
jgi:predicted AAA+ superfamily ATPase